MMSRWLFIPVLIFSILGLLPAATFAAQTCTPTPPNCPREYQATKCASGGYECTLKQALPVVKTASPATVPTPKTPVALPKPTTSSTLSFGSRGAAVSALQQQLVTLKYLTADSATGYFGNLTRAAVRKLQCDKLQICSGSEASNGWGSVGPKTKAAIATAQSAAITADTASAPSVSSGVGTAAYAQGSYSGGSIGYAQGTYAPSATYAQGSYVTTISTTSSGTASCAFDGRTIPHGATTRAYQTYAPVSGSVCVSEIRSCNNGRLSGSFVAATCTSDVVSVADFGAKCDAVESASGSTGTDDFPAFDAAIRSVSTRGGGTLLVPALGTKKCLWKMQAGQNPTLRVGSNTTIRMEEGVRLLVEGVPNGVNGYVNGAIINADQANGNVNISVLGGAFKAAGPGHGSVFVALKKVGGGKIQTTFLDNTASARAQVSDSAEIDFDVNIYYENAPWFKTPHPIQDGNYWAFEDGIRIGSGSHNITLKGTIHSGDDAIALNNEPAETGGSFYGNDIHDVTIGPVVASTQRGNILRLYQQDNMLRGQIYGVYAHDITGTARSVGEGASGVSIADYSGRRSIWGVHINGMNLDTAGVSGANSAGIRVINTADVSLNTITLTNPPQYGLTRNDALRTAVLNSNIPGVLVNQ